MKNVGNQPVELRRLLQSGAAAWNRLSAEERRPGAVAVGDVSFDAAYHRPVPAGALVLRQNGDVLLSERLTGIHLSSDGGRTFGAAIAGSPEVDCMRERDDGVLYVCSKSFAPQNMALGTSTDGVTWTPILTYNQVDDAYPSCANGTDQHDVCFAMRWCCIVDQFDIDDPACEGICENAFIDAGPSDAQCEGDADCETPPKKKGCCSTGTPGSGAFLLTLFVLFSLLNSRRNAY